MDDALSDALTALDAIGDFGDAFIGLYDAKVQSTVNRKAIEIGESRNAFLLRMSLPPDDPNKIDAGNWQDELAKYNNEVSSSLESINDPLVRNRVKAEFAASEGSFNLSLSKNMYASMIADTRSNYKLTLDDIANGIGSAAEKAASIDMVLSEASDRKYFDPTEMATLRATYYDPLAARAAADKLVSDENELAANTIEAMDRREEARKASHEAENAARAASNGASGAAPVDENLAAHSGGKAVDESVVTSPYNAEERAIARVAGDKEIKSSRKAALIAVLRGDIAAKDDAVDKTFKNVFDKLHSDGGIIHLGSARAILEKSGASSAKRMELEGRLESYEVDVYTKLGHDIVSKVLTAKSQSLIAPAKEELLAIAESTKSDKISGECRERIKELDAFEEKLKGNSKDDSNLLGLQRYNDLKALLVHKEISPDTFMSRVMADPLIRASSSAQGLVREDLKEFGSAYIGKVQDIVIPTADGVAKRLASSSAFKRLQSKDPAQAQRVATSLAERLANRAATKGGVSEKDIDDEFSRVASLMDQGDPIFGGVPAQGWFGSGDKKVAEIQEKIDRGEYNGLVTKDKLGRNIGTGPAESLMGYIKGKGTDIIAKYDNVDINSLVPVVTTGFDQYLVSPKGDAYSIDSKAGSIYVRKLVPDDKGPEVIEGKRYRVVDENLGAKARADEKERANKEFYENQKKLFGLDVAAPAYVDPMYMNQ